MDEATFLAATPTAPTRFVTGLVDLRPVGGGPARLLDVADGRCGPVLSGWLAGQGGRWCARIGVAVLDPLARLPGGAAHRAAERHGGRDAFHPVRLAIDAVDQVRRRVQQHTSGRRGRWCAAVRHPTGEVARAGQTITTP